MLDLETSHFQRNLAMTLEDISPTHTSYNSPAPEKELTAGDQ